MLKTSFERFRDRLPESWAKLLMPKLDKAWVEGMEQRLSEASALGELAPAAERVFRPLESAGPEAVRVLILGQDPYPGKGLANGLAFSVAEGQKIPPSLKNILKELGRDLPEALSDSWQISGDLSGWARQGVMLMNAHWTTTSGRSLAHVGWGWDRFTDAVISVLIADPQPKVFLAWGLPAQRRLDGFEAFDHPVLRSSHPSPLSAHKGFLGCGHFGEVNRLLVERKAPPIDWRL